MRTPTSHLIERLDTFLDEAWDHPGIHHYLKTHDVVYHGTQGRFRIYSAHLTDKPSGKIQDLSKLPRVKAGTDGRYATDTLSPAHPVGNADDHPPGEHVHPTINPDAVIAHHPSAMHGLPLHTRAAMVANQSTAETHAAGNSALYSARRADQALTHLGMPPHKVTVVVTDHPVSQHGQRLSHSIPSTYRAVSAGTPQTDTVVGVYRGALHHIAVSTRPTGTSDDTLAHEWAHHYQKNMTGAEQEALSNSFHATTDRKGKPIPGTAARDYGRTSWAEWHATGIEHAVITRGHSGDLGRYAIPRPLSPKTTSKILGVTLAPASPQRNLRQYRPL